MGSQKGVGKTSLEVIFRLSTVIELSKEPSCNRIRLYGNRPILEESFNVQELGSMVSDYELGLGTTLRDKGRGLL